MHSNITSHTKNLLPYDGEVFYFGCIFDNETANNYFQRFLNEILWQPDEAIIFGKHIITKRKVAWYGERAFEYKYSNITKQAHLWIPLLIDLKKEIEAHTAETYNSCLLNLYHNGTEGMAWHSDGEKDLKPNGAIASVSFGAQRRFAFKHKQNKTKVNCDLQHGSLLVMKGVTQTHWLHRLPPVKNISTARINLTFRTIVDNQ